MFKSSYLKLIVFYTSFIWFVGFSKAILPPYFLSHGLTLNQIIFGAGMSFLGILFLLIIKFSNFIKARLSWQLALLSAFVYILLVINISSYFKFYIASFIYGFATFFFYIFYNIAHFKNTPREKTGHSSAVMFSVGPIVSIGAPLLAGFLAQINFLFVWIFSGVFFLLAAYLARRQNNFPVKYEIRPALKEIRATRSFIFLEGIWEAMIFGIIPVYTLFFIKTSLGYGTFLAYLSLTAVLANLILGKFTDKIQKRIIFLYPLTIIIAVITFLFPLATSNIVFWVIITGALQFFVPLFWNISTAMVIDGHPNLELSIPGREIMLTLGRVLGLGLSFLSFYFEKTPFYIFIFLGFVMLIYPLNLYWKTKFKKQYVYL